MYDIASVNVQYEKCQEFNWINPILQRFGISDNQTAVIIGDQMITHSGIVTKLDISSLKQVLITEETFQMYNCSGAIETPVTNVSDFFAFD